MAMFANALEERGWRITRDPGVRPDLANPLAFDHDDLIRRRGAVLRVDQPPGADGFDLLRRRWRLWLPEQPHSADGNDGQGEHDAFQHEDLLQERV